MAAGKPKTVRGQAQAILDELRKKTVYVQDPVNTELIARPHVTLCLDEHGLCMPAADCFPEGTLLLRDDMEFVPIQDIQVGDRIWGHNDWTVVQNKWFKGELELDAVQMNNGSTALLTPDHKMWVARCDRHNRRTTTPPCPCPIDDLRLERVKVSELKKKDRLIQPKRVAFGSESMDPDRAWIEGLFVSDGWTSHDSSFEISGQDGCPKEANKRKIEALCKAWGIPTKWYRKYISVSDRSWSQRMQKMGHRAPNKHALSINLSEEAAGRLLDGIMADSGQHTNDLGRTFTTTSRQLMLQTRVLHRMFGRSCGYSYIVNHGGLGENPIWRLSVRATKRAEKVLRVRDVQRAVTRAPCWDIATSDHMVYLPEHDVTVSNCDDLCVCLGSALLSLGIETRVLGQAYGTEQATHVILAVYDPADGWLKIDPSSDSYPVGQCYPATKDWWVDPISGRTSSTVSGPAIHPGKEPEQGDFIGVGAIPFPHAFSVMTHGAAYAPVGMENPPPPGYCCNTCFADRRRDIPCPQCFSILQQDEVSSALGQLPSLTPTTPTQAPVVVVRRRPIWPALITGAVLGSLFVVIGVAIGESSK